MSARIDEMLAAKEVQYGGASLFHLSPKKGETLARFMRSRALNRLDYNGSRSGRAAPATELARYVLALTDVLAALSSEDATRQSMSATEAREVCEICEQPYAVWFAPSELWNAVMREGVKGNPDWFAMVCPRCFALEAERLGRVPTAWVLSEEQP